MESGVSRMNIHHCSALPYFAIACTCAIYLSCSVSDSEDDDYSKWNFSGSVVDSDSNLGLSKAKITYQDESGDVCTIDTDEDGNFFIDDIPFGSTTFSFSYEKIKDKDTLYYAPKILTINSTSESSHMEGVVASSSKVVRLSPLNANVSGEFYIDDEIHARKIPVKNMELSLANDDSNYVNLFPKTFYTKTDSMGKFSFKNLPADTGLTLIVTAIEIEGQHYSLEPIALPRLKASSNTNLGRKYLVRDTVIKIPSVLKSSNMLDENFHGYKNVSSLVTPFYVFKEKLSTKNLSVTVKCDTNIFYVNPVVKSDTLYLNHDEAFPSESEISVSIVAYGKKSGERMAIDISGDSAFVTSRGIYAVTSNAWASNKDFKSVFSIDDTIWIKFSDTLAKNINQIRWNFVKDRTIYGDDSYTNNADAWIHVDTLFVQMKEKILDSTRKPGDSVWMNLTVYAKNGSYLKGFVLGTELYVPESSSSSEPESSSSSSESSDSSDKSDKDSDNSSTDDSKSGSNDSDDSKSDSNDSNDSNSEA